MVEDVVEVDANLEPRRFAEPEELAQTKVHAPGAWSNQRIAFGDVRVIENVGAGGWQSEGRRIEELIASDARIRIADDARTKTRPGEVADSINKAAGDVAWKNRITVVAVPVRREAGAALGEHVPCNLITSKNSFFPLRSRRPKAFSFTERNVERAIRDESMT